jgi:hypothetical protein
MSSLPLLLLLVPNELDSARPCNRVHPSAPVVALLLLLAGASLSPALVRPAACDRAMHRPFALEAGELYTKSTVLQLTEARWAPCNTILIGDWLETLQVVKRTFERSLILLSSLINRLHIPNLCVLQATSTPIFQSV